MRTDDEFRVNQAKHERMLDEAFSLSPQQEPDSPARTHNFYIARAEHEAIREPVPQADAQGHAAVYQPLNDTNTKEK